MSIFSSIKIVDLSRVFSGPYATLQFANFGAEVIKVEPPYGDDSRQFPPLKDGWSGYYELLNHNKKAIFLDLKNDEDREKLYSLCREADVVVENYAPDVKRRLEIDYRTISQHNSEIIYASLSGVSENVDKKYYDLIAQAESGFISLNGETEDMKVSTAIVDAFAGMKLANAIAAALFAREKTGKGTHISVSLKGSALELLEQNLIEASITGKNPEKVGNLDSAIAPFGLFKTQDSAIALAAGSEKLWKSLLKLLLENNQSFPADKLSTNELRLKNRLLLREAIEAVFIEYTTAQLIEQLSALEIPCGQVKKMLDVLQDQENFDEQLLEMVDHPVGRIAIPTGGVFYSNYKRSKYVPAPKMK